MSSDAYYLNPPGAPRGPDVPGSMLPGYSASLKRWTAPHIMEAINGRVVRRTNALLRQRCVPMDRR